MSLLFFILFGMLPGQSENFHHAQGFYELGEIHPYRNTKKGKRGRKERRVTLNSDVFHHIMMYIHPKKWPQLKLVCRDWKHFTESHTYYFEIQDIHTYAFETYSFFCHDVEEQYRILHGGFSWHFIMLMDEIADHMEWYENRKRFLTMFSLLYPFIFDSTTVMYLTDEPEVQDVEVWHGHLHWLFLSKMRNLRHLHVRPGMEHRMLESNVFAKRIYLSKVSCLKCLKTCLKVEYLSIEGSDLTLEMLNAIPANLKALVFKSCHFSNPVDFINFCKKHTQLERLSLQGTQGDIHEILKGIPYLYNLEMLDLSDMEQLSDLTNLFKIGFNGKRGGSNLLYLNVKGSCWDEYSSFSSDKIWSNQILPKILKLFGNSSHHEDFDEKLNDTFEEHWYNSTFQEEIPEDYRKEFPSLALLSALQRYADTIKQCLGCSGSHLAQEYDPETGNLSYRWELKGDCDKYYGSTRCHGCNMCSEGNGIDVARFLDLYNCEHPLEHYGSYTTAEIDKMVFLLTKFGLHKQQAQLLDYVRRSKLCKKCKCSLGNAEDNDCCYFCTLSDI